MCQSKAEGGLRCSAHTKEALTKHASKQAEFVAEYATAFNITLPTPESLYTDDDARKVSTLVNRNPEYIAAGETYQKAQKDRRDEEMKIFRIAEYGGTNDSLALHLWANNKEAQALKAEQQRNWDNGVEDELLHNKLAALREMTTAQAKGILGSIRRHGVYNPNDLGVPVPQYMSDLREKEKEARDTYAKLRSSLAKVEKAKILNHKLRHHPKYINIVGRADYQNTPFHKEWNEKQRKLLTDYSLTNEYRKKLETLIENEPADSPERNKVQRQLNSVAKLRERTKQRNIEEALGKSA